MIGEAAAGLVRRGAGVPRANAHAPYSHFLVGAAIRTASGRIFAGSNVENVSFPEGICAEAAAIGAMVTAGERDDRRGADDRRR